MQAEQLNSGLCHIYEGSEEVIRAAPVEFAHSVTLLTVPGLCVRLSLAISTRKSVVKVHRATA